jgi:uncharacterized membrane protein
MSDDQDIKINVTPESGSETVEEPAETTSSEPEAAEAPAVEAAPIEAAPVLDGKEVEEGKAFAILSYALGFLGLPFFLVPLVMRNNAFSLYHSKQCLMIWLAGIAGGMISGILVAVFCLGIITGFALGIFILVVEIIGLINASKGEMKPLPLIGAYAEDWFKGITKV